jgi:hypothetical protein
VPEPHLKKVLQKFGNVKYFLYLCTERSDLQIGKKREGESPSETHYGLEN